MYAAPGAAASRFTRFLGAAIQRQRETIHGMLRIHAVRRTQDSHAPKHLESADESRV